MSGHTPGPWEHDGVAVFPRSKGDTEAYPVAELLVREGMTTEEKHANGYLIAAAPDLLAACELVLALNDNPDARVRSTGMSGDAPGQPMGWRIGGAGPLLDPKALSQLRAAIAKARGE